jgi:hypothetical protein
MVSATVCMLVLKAVDSAVICLQWGATRGTLVMLCMHCYIFASLSGLRTLLSLYDSELF